MYRVGGIPKGTNPSGFGNGLLEDLKTFRVQLQACQVCPSSDVPSGARQARDEPAPNRIGDKPDDDRYRRGRLLGRQGRWCGRGEDEVNLETDEVSSELGKPILLSLRVANVNGNVLALVPAELAKSSTECLQVRRTRGRRSEFEIPDPRDLRGLLRLCSRNRREYAQSEDDRPQDPLANWFASVPELSLGIVPEPETIAS
jgi:hypothetical protein